MTCDGADVLVKTINIPEDIEVHDWFCFGGMGIYTLGPKSNFNGMQSTTRIFEWNANVNDNNKWDPI